MDDHLADALHIWGDPESKIQFLETSLQGRHWRATITFPAGHGDPAAKRNQVKQSLEERGYITQAGQDEHGNLTLTIHHIGKDTDVVKLLGEVGVTRGLSYQLKHPWVPVRYMIRGAQAGVDSLGSIITDPAKFNGMLYVTAEAFIAASGFMANAGRKKSVSGIKDPHIGLKNRANLLLSAFGGLCLSQSAIYLLFAKSKEDLALDDLKHKIGDTHHKQTNVTGFAEKDDKKEGGPLHGVKDFLQKYPIQMGAVLNNLGMVAYITQAFLNRSHAKLTLAEGKLGAEELKSAQKYLASGFKRDIGGALTSVAAWTMLMVQPKHYDKKSDNPIEAAYQSLRENPQYVSGALTILSSSQRLLGARDRENMLQLVGEAIYLPGDFLLFFTKNDEYGHGSKKEGDPAKLAAATAEFLKQTPVAMGPEAREKFIHDISYYLVRKTSGHQGQAGANHGVSQTPQAAMALGSIDQKATHLMTLINDHLSKKGLSQFDKIAVAAAGIAEMFPSQQQPAVIQRLSQAVSRLSGVYAMPEEVQRAVLSRMKGQSNVQQLPAMPALGAHVAELVFAIPNLEAGNNAAAIYDALKPAIVTSPADAQTLHMAVAQKAEMNISGQSQQLAPATIGTPKLTIATPVMAHLAKQSAPPAELGL